MSGTLRWALCTGEGDTLQVVRLFVLQSPEQSHHKNHYAGSVSDCFTMSIYRGAPFSIFLCRLCL